LSGPLGQPGATTLVSHPRRTRCKPIPPPTGNGPSSTADQAKDKAQEAAGQAKGALRSQVDQRSTDAGQRVGGLASDVRSVGEQLREQGKDRPAKVAEQAADRAERVSSYLTRTTRTGSSATSRTSDAASPGP
jgi:hypothetical protein